jgi:hypothetical protein
MTSRFCLRLRWSTGFGSCRVRDCRAFRSISILWIRHRVERKYDRAIKMPSKEYEALTSAVSSNSNPSKAAREFTQPTRELVSSGGNIEEQLASSWNSLLSVAANTEHESQGPLVEIVQAVQQEDISADSDAKTIKIWGEDVKVWKDLPLLGPSLRGAWNRGRHKLQYVKMLG